MEAESTFNIVKVHIPTTKGCRPATAGIPGVLVGLTLGERSAELDR